MKEFRKWWENHRASTGPHTCQSSRGENLIQLADEEIWRAALEMVLQIKITSDPSVYLKMLRDKIRDELGDA